MKNTRLTRTYRKTSGSTRVVRAALAGNVAVSLAKFGAYAFSGSSAMLTEAVHSLVDSVDQVLLLVGQSRARKPRDAAHPLGYGLESYFWSFVVALMVLLAGGMTSLYQGFHRLRSPGPITSPALSFAVLAAAAVFEGSSLTVSYREYKRLVRGRDVPLWTFIGLSKDPSLFASLLEDWAALIGLGIAAAGLTGVTVFHLEWADGAASLAIGTLMTAVAVVLANETRSLIAGEAVAPRVMQAIRTILEADPRIDRVIDIATLHLGPQAILVALTLNFKRETTLSELRRAIRDLTAAMQRADGRIAYVYVRPDPPDPP